MHLKLYVQFNKLGLIENDRLLLVLSTIIYDPLKPAKKEFSNRSNSQGLNIIPSTLIRQITMY